MVTSVIQLCSPLVLPAPLAATAGWTTKTDLNLAVCTAPGDQIGLVMVADDSGGAIVAWMDKRGGDWDIYAQHLLVTGSVDPAWPVNGRAICAARKDQRNPQIQADGAGGAIIVWEDARGNDWDVYAQRILAGGAVDPGWSSDGLAVASAGGDQRSPGVVVDGIGGAILAWFDVGHGIHAQRILVNGTLDSAWAPAGRVLCSSDSTEMSFRMVANGDSGAIVVWCDGSDVRAQRVSTRGATAPPWPSDGRLVSKGPGARQSPAIVGDGAGGVIVVWTEERGVREGIVNAQHVRADGIVDPAWPADGCKVSPTKLVSVAPGEGWGTIPAAPLVADGAGGAILVCSGESHDVQHVLASGALDPNWPREGCRLSNYFGDHGFKAVTDGSGGAIAVWSHELDGFHFSFSGPYLTLEGNIVAQHVLSSGVVDHTWPKQGRQVTTAKGRQSSPGAIADGDGGAIVVWEDERGDVADIYAQRIRLDSKPGGAAVVRPRLHP